MTNAAMRCLFIGDLLDKLCYHFEKLMCSSVRTLYECTVLPISMSIFRLVSIWRQVILAKCVLDSHIVVARRCNCACNRICTGIESRQWICANRVGLRRNGVGEHFRPVEVVGSNDQSVGRSVHLRVCKSEKCHAPFELASRAVLRIAVSMANISWQSASMERYASLERYPVLDSSSSQYPVSSHSFKAMDILATKSDLLWAELASRTLAPIDVPDRSTCFEMTVSRFSSVRYRYSFTIRTANAMLFPAIKFSFHVIICHPPTLHFTLYILHSTMMSALLTGMFVETSVSAYGDTGIDGTCIVQPNAALAARAATANI